jgi:cytochrome c oxidase assembly factor CtaG
MPRLARAAEVVALAGAAAFAHSLAAPLGALAGGLLPTAVLALPVINPAAVPPEPTLSTLWTGWSLDVEYLLPTVLVAWFYWAAVRKVNREHPTNPVPRKRLWYWLAGLGVLIVAVESPIGLYDSVLFSDHMIQHLLLAMVAPPLLILGAPITLALRVATPEARQRYLLPLLHSRVVRFLGNPAVSWLIFTVYMFASHFSGLYELSLENSSVHVLEHMGFLITGMLFWWPVIGVDPSPRRLSWPGRLMYLGLGMPWSSFLGLAILSATTLLYPWYGAVPRTWGFSPLEDQVWAGGFMWAGGDGLFLIGLVLALAAWLKAEEAEGRRLDLIADRKADREAGAAGVAGVAGVARGAVPVNVGSALEPSEGGAQQ